MPTDKIQTGLRLRPEALRKITYIAKREKRSMNAQIEYLIDECIREYEAEYGAVPEEK